MPAITRSQTRSLLNHLKNAPYPVDFLTRVKSKYPQSHEELKDLINTEITPPPETIIDAIIDIARNCMDENDLLNQQNGQIRAFHALGDILYKCLTPVRKHIYDKTQKTTSAFIDSWQRIDIDDDTTEEAKILTEFIKKGAKNKAENYSYFQARFQRYKTWLRMYAERCQLVYNGFDDMEPQEIWNALKDVETDVNSGAIIFENEDSKRYALEAIADMRLYKFDWKNNRWEDKNGNKIQI